MPLTRRLIRPGGVITVCCWILMAATTAMAQPGAGTVTETVTTQKDLNGRESVSQKVVTHRALVNHEERVVIETYQPLMYADRLELTQRVRRVTTVVNDGSQTVEEIEERNPGSPEEPLRLVKRSVTTARRSGGDSYVIERLIFERDVNGRLVPIMTQPERTSRD